MLDYREIRPCPALAGHVECLWYMTGGADAAPIERILPDGCVELVMHVGDPFRRWTPAGRTHAQPRSFVVGPSLSFLLLQPSARVDTLGVRFRPGAARSLLHAPLHEIAERTLPLETLVGAPGRQLPEVVGNAPSRVERVRLVETWLLRRLQQARGNARIHPSVALAVHHRGDARVSHLARATGVTTRQLERIFLNDVGLGPKSLLRLARFQAVFGAVDGTATPDWADIAIACGYTDQAHLIRDFRGFSGETPASLLREQGQLSRHFTSPERLQAFFADERR